ncbi:C2H2 and C2HC zinc finger [Pyrenophora seminiperda CCB06]|uniref:C2H2 and C2HC zinc finger n=1 Tax=Pyrenophora seminiperda CCB06 TaxID=1302712 RepID=A0A3M7MFC5_9PLEO|nr:C2H2 and C2HC zinc finger [Pyrenophora seminiperda CCB06]
MPESHRPDYEERVSKLLKSHDASNHEKELNVEQSLFSDAKWWPYINLEDLAKPKCLLTFLNTRGRNPPMAFALTELMFSPLILAEMLSGKLGLGHNRHVMYFSKVPDPALYGKVSATARTVEKYNINEDGLECCPRFGLPILHIQNRIYQFLVACSQLILHDMNEDTLLRGQIQEQPPTSDVKLYIDAGQTHNSDLHMVASYRNRGSIDFVKLLGYFNALYTSAKDHILALREDPSYFADWFAEIADHSPKMILDVHNSVHSALDSPEVLMGKAHDIIIEAYMGFTMWKQLYEMAEKLVNASQLPQDELFSRLVAQFGRRVQKASVLLSKMLNGYHAAAPNIRKLYVRTNDSLTNPKIGFKPGEKCTLDQYWLLISFRRIYQNEKDPHSAEKLYHMLDNVATIMRKSRPAKDLMSPRLSDLFAQLSIVGECQMDCELWYKTPQGHQVDRTVPHSDEFSHNWIYQIHGCQLPVQSANPFRGKLAYPIHKVRNRKNVKIMRAAEASLDKFWDCVDRFYESEDKKGQHGIFRQCVSESGSMQRTPPWEAPLTTKTESPGQQSCIYEPFSRILHDTTLQFTGTFNKLAIQEKVKPKTKGDTATPVIVNEIAPAPETNTPTWTIKLDKRAYKTMKALFHVSVSDTEDFPKAIKWDDFKRAMVRIGFAAEKLQGSAWQFTPGPGINVNRGIHFHEPHPESEIPYVMARRIGRRLEQVYGWCGETFRHS